MYTHTYTHTYIHTYIPPPVFVRWGRGAHDARRAQARAPACIPRYMHADNIHTYVHA